MDFGPFSDHIGIDGTSILAAITSGPEHVALHLLTCMLATMHPNPAEATAIWYQIVQCRLAELELTADPNQLKGIAAQFAITQGLQITRDDLRAFDNTQMRLIIKNVPSIRTFGSTYADVMKNWSIAMCAVQNAISGSPQEIRNGAIILGFLSWHLYPDVQVFNPDKLVLFHDGLVKPDGTITLGLESSSELDGGVRWSLALSHLRHYGEPVQVERSLNDDGRITLRELRLIALGSFIHSWDKPESVNIEDVAKCFAALGKAAKLDMVDSMERLRNPTVPELSLDWITPLIDASGDFLSMEGREKENALHRIEYGRRRGRNLLDSDFRNTPAMFGLLNPYLQSKLSRKPHQNQQLVESKVLDFRSLAKKCGFHESDAIIVSRPLAILRAMSKDDIRSIQGNVEVVSAVEQSLQSRKRSPDGDFQKHAGHCRWIHVDRTANAQEQRYLDLVEDYEKRGIDGRSVDLPLFDAEVGPTTIISTDFKTNNYRFLVAKGCRCHDEKDNDGSLDSGSMYHDGTKQHPCDMRCICVQEGVKCTSLCSCLSHFDGSPAGPACRNVRRCQSEVVGLQEEVSWLSTRSIAAIRDRNLSIGFGGKFEWIDPPASFEKRYKSQRDSRVTEMIAENDCLPPMMAQPIEFETLHPYVDFTSWTMDDGNVINRSVEFTSVEACPHAALFLSKEAAVDMPSVSLAELTGILHSGRLDAELLRNYLRQVPQSGLKDHSKSLSGVAWLGRSMFPSLQALFRASQLYHTWPGATVSIHVSKRPLSVTHWARMEPKAFEDHHQNQLHRNTKFACLTYLESGEHDLHVDQFKHVMAVASGNSIYAAEFLLQDPCRSGRSSHPDMHGIHRMLGNLGLPGIVLLVPPPDPLVLRLGIEEGAKIKVEDFNGELVNRFQSTSLHLRCTDFIVPVAGGAGAVDADVVIREAVVQVYDGPRWVTDLDVLSSLGNRNLKRLSGCACDISGSSKGLALQKYSDRPLRSVTSWDEVLLCQENLIGDETAIVLTTGSWYARLAIAGLAGLKGWPAVVWPEESVCENCVRRFVEGDEPLEHSKHQVRLYIM
ncbi:hypothetical protein K456DRAFT_1695185 [Colletotrichum gloeosporioides 23]|nr:hypothetical protein K456DRAFT_1695185 [Colletotrichum gloeosporioides 23]